jgi:hypothetical protein
MTTTPTPDEAKRALQDIEARRQQTTVAATSSRWWWIGSGVVLAVYGALVDRLPHFAHTWGNTIIWGLILVTIARRTRWGGPLLGQQVRPRQTGGVALRLGLGLFAAILVLGMAIGAIWLKVPHLSLGFGIGAGLLIALAGPWWERRRLERSVRS